MEKVVTHNPPSDPRVVANRPVGTVKEAVVDAIGSGTVSHLPPHLPPSGLSYHALLMPSLTENFSYTVLESLQAGIPVLISDQTPWRDLEAQGIGWDFSLSDSGRWLQALEQLSGQSSEADAEQAHRALKYAREWGADYSRKAATLFFTQSHEATERSIQ